MSDLFGGSSHALGYEPTKVQCMANVIAIHLTFRYPLKGHEREAWDAVRAIADNFELLAADKDPEATSIRMKGFIEAEFQRIALKYARVSREAA